MEDDRIKRCRMGTAYLVEPTPNSLVVPLLAQYGVPRARIVGYMYKGDEFQDLDADKYRDYSVAFFGVSPDEGLPTRFIFGREDEKTLDVWHIVIYWRDVYDACIQASWSEEHRDFIVTMQLGRLDTLNPKAAKCLADGFALLLWAQERMTPPRGGDRRPQEIQQLWVNEEVLKRYALLVDEIAPVWTTVKGLAHHCDSEDSQKEWVSSLLERRAIKNLIADYPKLTEHVLRRAVDNTLKKIDREPRQLAYFHAALELEVNINGDTLSIMDAYLKYEDKPPAPSTLKTLYDKGKALLK
jgi:hypothetical protein